MSKKIVCRLIHKMLMSKDPFVFQNDMLCKCQTKHWCKIKFGNHKEYFPSNYKEFKNICSKFVDSSKK